jgi:hypothetical protein
VPTPKINSPSNASNPRPRPSKTFPHPRPDRLSKPVRPGCVFVSYQCRFTRCPRKPPSSKRVRPEIREATHPKQTGSNSLEVEESCISPSSSAAAANSSTRSRILFSRLPPLPLSLIHLRTAFFSPHRVAILRHRLPSSQRFELFQASVIIWEGPYRPRGLGDWMHKGASHVKPGKPDSSMHPQPLGRYRWSYLRPAHHGPELTGRFGQCFSHAFPVGDGECVRGFFWLSVEEQALAKRLKLPNS